MSRDFFNSFIKKNDYEQFYIISNNGRILTCKKTDAHQWKR